MPVSADQFDETIKPLLQQHCYQCHGEGDAIRGEGDRRQLTQYQRPKGIEVEALPNQQIELKQNRDRGGLLTMPGVLAMNSGPILRGTWILARVLGEHLGDPPANVGEVPAGGGEGRQGVGRERRKL